MLKRRGEKEDWQNIKYNDVQNSTAIISRQRVICKVDFTCQLLELGVQSLIIWTR